MNKCKHLQTTSCRVRTVHGLVLWLLPFDFILDTFVGFMTHMHVILFMMIPSKQETKIVRDHTRNYEYSL